MGTSRSKTAPAIVRAQRNQEKAVEMRIQGWSFAEIGKACGVGKTQAYRYVTKAMIETASRISDLAVVERMLELARLDRMQLGIYARAIAGDIQMIDRVLAIMARRAKYLGLDVAVRQETSGNYTITGPDGKALQVEGDIGIDAFVGEIVRLCGGPFPAATDTDSDECAEYPPGFASPGAVGANADD